VSSGARRRHALGYLEPAVLDRLEALEAELGDRGADADVQLSRPSGRE
jgi:hypothetical protein